MLRAQFIEIIKKFRNGDSSGMERIYDEYFGKLCATALRIVGNRQSAYDIASETILKLMDGDFDVAAIRNHEGYLFVMVRNRAYNFLERRKRSENVAEFWQGGAGDLPDTLWLEDIYKLLTEDEKELFVCHIVWDMTLRQSARHIGITYGAAKARYANVARKIKALYGGN